MPALPTVSPKASSSSRIDLPVRVRGCCSDLPEAIPDAQAQALARALRALADPTRLQMVHMLRDAGAPVCVCDFTAAFDLSQPTVSHHLAKLREAEVVETFKQGIWAFYHLRSDLSPLVRAVVDLIP